MKNFISALALLLLPMQLLAQHTLSGRVTDAARGEALPGATVTLMSATDATSGVTDQKGYYRFTGLQAGGTYGVVVSYLGFETVEQKVTMTANRTLDISLNTTTVRAQEVVVTATRATEKTGTTYTNVSREEIEARNFGQDLPYLLEQTPSVVVNSDAGAGVGYTGIRIRGSDITRINVTVNGVPINDPESHGVFFVNMPDFASSVQDIQIQRGVGTSTNGAGAFGASINMNTLEARREAYGEAINTYGSFNTWRHTASFGTGLIKDKFTLDGRLSIIKSDGYIDRAFSDLKSFYFAAGYHGETGMLKFVTFSGQEQTYQAWDGVPQEKLETDRTFNPFTYDNETDNYQQDHYQLHYAKNLGYFDLGGAFHLTKGRGYYEQYRERQRFANYGLEPIKIENTTINRTDLIRRRWLDNDFYGATFALNYTAPAERFTASFGGAWNRYDGDHFGEIIWARYASTSSIRHRYYDNNAVKTDFNLYSKANYQVTERLGLFGDLQYRTIGYKMAGIDNNRFDITQNVDFRFWNPKAGVTFALTDGQVLYGSFARSNREPVRRDYTDQNATDRERGVQPQAERLNNWEAGYRLRGSGFALLNQAARYSIDANLFLMNYKNQLVHTGQLNDVGAPVRTNIPDSYRRGVEVAGLFNLNEVVELATNLSYSRNKIKNYRELVYVYDPDYNVEGTVETNYPETDISFSPAFVSTHRLEVQPLKGLKTALIYKTVSKQYIDNTSSEDRKIDGYQVLDLRLRYSFKPTFMKEVELALLVNNLLSAKYEANAYTWSEMYAGDATRYDYNFYYPQATRNFLLSLGLKF